MTNNDGTVYEMSGIDLYNLCVVTGVCALFFGFGFCSLLWSLRFVTF